MKENDKLEPQRYREAPTGWGYLFALCIQLFESNNHQVIIWKLLFGALGIFRFSFPRYTKLDN